MRVSGLLDGLCLLQVRFVGPEGSAGKLEQAAMKVIDLRLMPEVLYNHLLIMHVLHGAVAPPSIDEITAMINDEATRAAMPLNTAEHITDDRVENAMKAAATDIAGVRATGDDDTEVEAGLETRGQPEPSLVPVGALEEPKQEMSAVLGCIAEAVNKADVGEKPETDIASGDGIVMKRGDNTHNDYDRQVQTLYEAFWPLFLLRRGFRYGKALPDPKYRHLFLYYDNRFAHSMPLLFCLANSRMRHAVNKGVTARVKSSSECFEEFSNVVNDPSFLALLEEAMQEPDGKGDATTRVLSTVLRFLNLSSKHVPFGNGQRRGEITQLMAHHRFGGPASDFFNLAPDDVHNPLAIRWMHAFTGYSEFPSYVRRDDGAVESNFIAALRGATAANRIVADGSVPGGCHNMGESVLQQMAATNPIACTLFFERTVTMMLKHVLKVIGLIGSDLRKYVANHLLYLFLFF